MYVGAFVAAMAMLYRTSFLPDWNSEQERSLLREYIHNQRYRADSLNNQMADQMANIRAERDARGEKLLWTAIAGAVVLVLGVGIAVSAKE